MQKTYYLRALIYILLFSLAACGTSPVNTSGKADPKPTATSHPAPTPIRLTSTATASVDINADDWPTYLMRGEKDGFDPDETTINTTTASSLELFWTYHARGTISTQPVVVNNTIYWGSWDGFEHATNLSGKEIWATNLGTSSNIECSPSEVGVASTATVAAVTIGKTKTLILLVGGGDGNFYALNASNGKVIWKDFLGESPDHFIWSSPVTYRGSVYIGIASLGDCPSVQGQLVQMNMVDGTIQNIFNVVPGGCIGGGIWGSPTIDTKSGEIYVATGEINACTIPEYYAASLIELHAANLEVADSWQVPADQQTLDSDFGSTPTLFTATTGGVAHPMVGVINKNGIYYAFQRGAISNGPLWSRQLSTALGSIAPSAWDGKWLYVAGGNTTIHGKFCDGSLRALNPATGASIWEHCLTNGRVFAAVTVIPGVVVVGDRRFVTAMETATGKTLFEFEDPNQSSFFYSAATISHGALYVGNNDGNLYAFTLFAKQKQTK